MRSTANRISTLLRAWTDEELSDPANWDFRDVEPGAAGTALEYELQRELSHAHPEDGSELPPPFLRLIDEFAGIERTTFAPVYIPQRLRRGPTKPETFVAVDDPSRLRPAPEAVLPPEYNALGPGREPSGKADPGAGEPYQWPSHTVRSPEFGPRMLVAIDPRDLFWRLQYGNREALLKDLAVVCHLPEPSPTKAGRQVDWPWLQAPVPAWLKVAPLELLRTLGFLRLLSAGRPEPEAWTSVYRAKFPLDIGKHVDREPFERQLRRERERIRVHLDGMKEYLRTPRTWVALRLADK